MNPVLRCQSGHRKAARHTLAPDVHVFLRIGHDRQFSGRAGRSLNSYDLFIRHCLKSERIVVTQVLLCRKRKFRDIFDSFDISRFYTEFFHLFRIKRNDPVHSFYKIFQFFPLKYHPFIFAHTFCLRITDLFLPCFVCYHALFLL